MIKINIKYLEELKVSFQESPRDTFPKKEVINLINGLIELAKIQFNEELLMMEKDLKQIVSNREKIVLKNNILHIIKKGEK